MSERATVKLPSKPFCFTTFRTCWAPGGPTGITMMPSGLSCCRSGGGTWAMPAGLDRRQGRRRPVVDAAGDDDLVERRRLFPAVVAVALLGGDRLILAIAAADQPIIDLAGALGERLDDFDRPDSDGE